MIPSLYNTETRESEKLTTLVEGKIRLYTCGPTVYNFAHIGNFRTYVFEDILKRALQSFGYDVDHVMNITDVDDKTIRGAIENNQTLEEFTQPFTRGFFDDLDALNIERADHYPKATDFIDQMIAMITKLLEKKIAYQGSDGGVYFSIHAFPKYGRLSHLKLDELKVGASQRVGADEYDKDNASDFVLWKAYVPERDGKIFWESPFGKGRPGWHLECSVMAMSILGETIDIHVGGVDNIFPHHENEIAQSEACSEKLFVKHWLHSQHLLVEGKKMSKSLGNFYTLRDLLDKGYSGREVRLHLISTHYRSQHNFTLDGLTSSRATLTRIDDFVDRLENIGGGEGGAENLIEKTRIAFNEALADDLNISPALAALFEFIRGGNAACDQNQVGKEGAKQLLAFLHEIDRVLGVIFFQKEDLSIPPELTEALEKRIKARAEKNWAEADAMRDLILSRGYVIEDTPHGPRLKRG